MKIAEWLMRPANIPGMPGLSDWINCWKPSQVAFVVVIVLIQFITIILVSYAH